MARRLLECVRNPDQRRLREGRSRERHARRGCDDTVRRQEAARHCDGLDGLLRVRTRRFDELKARGPGAAPIGDDGTYLDEKGPVAMATSVTNGLFIRVPPA